MLVALNTSVVRSLKREIALIFPEAKSSALSESMARGLGSDTSSTMAAGIPEVDRRLDG